MVGVLWQTLSMDALAGLDGNNITAEVTLDAVTLQLKWSQIGKFPVQLMQVLMAFWMHVFSYRWWKAFCSVKSDITALVC